VATCGLVFDTADAALAHAVDSCGWVSNGYGRRVYDDEGGTCCLWVYAAGRRCGRRRSASRGKGKKNVWTLGGTRARAPRRNFRASGPSASVQNGCGRGFICLGGCGAVFDTPAEALKHGAERCGVVSNGAGGRLYDAAGRSRCTWEGCPRVFNASRVKTGRGWVVGGAIYGTGQLIDHEKQHMQLLQLSRG